MLEKEVRRPSGWVMHFIADTWKSFHAHGCAYVSVMLVHLLNFGPAPVAFSRTRICRDVYRIVMSLSRICILFRKSPIINEIKRNTYVLHQVD